MIDRPPGCPDCAKPLEYAGGQWLCQACQAHVLAPQPGPQTALLSSPADVIVYGGEVGGGKSWGLLFGAARHIDVPGYSAVIFRRESTQVTGPGSLWEESAGLYGAMGGKPIGNRLEWRFRTSDPKRDAIIAFGHLQYERDKQNHQGRAYAFLGFDEATHFTESQFLYLLSRNRSTCGVTPRVRMTTNPEPDSWVARLISWWWDQKTGYPIPERDGVVRYMARVGDDFVLGDTGADVAARSGQPAETIKSLTFIRSRLDDNQVLNYRDPGYRARVELLPKVERDRLLGGNWLVKAVGGEYFEKPWFEVVEAAPTNTTKRVRAWDLAATKPGPKNRDPDWSIGLLVSVDSKRTVYIEDMVALRDQPHGVDQAILNTASQDGRATIQCFWQDPGAAGKSDLARRKRELMGYSTDSLVAASGKGKVAWAIPVSSYAKAGNIKVVRGDWNGQFFQQLEGFPAPDCHDDVVDALSLAYNKLSIDNVERLRRLSRWVGQSH